MNQGNRIEQGKTRQNVSLSPSTKELFEQLAKDSDTTMSALLTQWILEKANAKRGGRGGREPKPNRPNTRQG